MRLSRDIAASGLSLVTFWGGFCLKGRWGWIVLACATVLGSLWGLSDAIDQLDDTLQKGSRVASWVVWFDWPALWVATITTGLAGMALLRSRTEEIYSTATPAARRRALYIWVPFIAIALAAAALSQASYWGSKSLLQYSVVEVSEHNNYKRHVVFGHYRGHRLLSEANSSAKYELSDSLEPPEGDATISGRVVKDGEPVAGLELRAIFNDLYQTSLLTTDARGRFAIPIERGQWALNFIELLHWPGKPANERLVPVSGHEPPPTIPYRLGSREEPPLRIFAREGSDDPQVTVRLKPMPQRQWPPVTDDPGGVVGTLANDALRWKPVPGASTYIVGIGVVGSDRGDMYTPRAWYGVAEGSSLPLQRVQTVKEAEHSGDKPPQAYSYRVFAFDADGQLLTFTQPLTPEKRRFQLRSDRVIESRRHPDGRLPEGIKTERQRERESNRFDTKTKAFWQLVKAGRREAAGEVLADLKKETMRMPAGKRAVFEGALEAMRGRCQEARAHYREAVDANPRLCAGACVNKSCSTARKQ